MNSYYSKTRKRTLTSERAKYRRIAHKSDDKCNFEKSGSIRVIQTRAFRLSYKPI